MKILLDENVYTEIEIFSPLSKPRGIVVVVPGTGGLSDMYFGEEIAKKNYSPDSKGGLTEKLIGSGYTAVFYNQRGYSTLSKCITGDSLYLRSASFVSRCVDPEIRKTVTFSKITADTEKIFKALNQVVETQGVPQLVLAFSEGIYHVNSLIENKEIDPVGVVAVGGPLESISYVMKFQLGFEFYLNLIEKAFLHCDSDVLNVNQIINCSDSSAYTGIQNSLITAMGGQTISKKDLPARQEFFKKFVHDAFDKYLKISETEYVNGSFLQFVLPKNWSAAYYTEAFSSKKSSVERLRKFPHKVIYMFGSLDHLVPIHSDGICVLDGLVASRTCQIEVVAGVGHGLEDKSMLPTNEALNKIIAALNSVNK
ncbi:hypothetical protein [Undibacterium sp. KW1]|uniref:hypothetical protein n=1 Tax=Undibacterium sp. KW1 TaxID=2058624 RepID=UPI00138A2314|nr:hypothetical protein [Undibacterium sp. KW1]